MEHYTNKITVLTTGGTIEKTYQEHNGQLLNTDSPISKELDRHLRLPHSKINFISVMQKDSSDMNQSDREKILETILKYSQKTKMLIVLHGTDTMTETATFCLERIADPELTLIFTGAMRPFGFVNSDAIQNLTEALMAVQLAKPGVYISFHNHLHTAKHTQKNSQTLTFEPINGFRD